MPSLSAPHLLRVDHDLSAFSCGKVQLDEFLRRHALDKQTAMLSRTYVVTTGESQVIAYYTLTHISVMQAEAPKKLGRGMPSSIPAILLARLAVDQQFHGRGLSRSLFSDALVRTWSVMKDGSVPVRFFVVDAKDEEAKTFYDKMRMQSSPLNPFRLFLHYKDLQTIFDPK